jgi:3-dehydroquinate synthetase
MSSGVEFTGSAFHARAPAEMKYSVDLTADVFELSNDLLAGYCEGRQVALFATRTIDALYGAAVRRYLAARLPAGSWHYVVTDTGEHNKNLRSVEAICEHAKTLRIDRNGLLIAVGGGILCDMVGFAASIYKRGIRYIKINTTLVGQIDVGVGIKTGVNFLSSKNLLGSYYPAFASINDPALLRTLPLRQISCGLAEIIKMAIILSQPLFELLEVHAESILKRRFGPGAPLEAERDLRVLVLAIQLMMDELRPNLHEKDLERLVDFGHSFSPIIEIESDHAIHHGEAVAIDMALSARIAVRLGLMEEADCERVLELLVTCGLPVYDAHTCQPALLQEALHEMHLHRGRKINLVIPTGIGRADFVRELAQLPAAVVEGACADLCQFDLRNARAAA